MSEDPREFAEIVLRALEASFPDRSFEYIEAEDLVQEASEGGMRHYLSNARAEYAVADAEGRDQVLQTMVHLSSKFAEGGPQEDHFHAVAERLVPRIIDLPYITQTKLVGRLHAKEGDEPNPLELATQPFCEGLVVGAVIDDPESMRYVTSDDLENWDVSLEEVLRYALQNLEIDSQESLIAAGPGLWESPWKDNHDLSRILLPLIATPEVRGDRVFAIPNRDHLFITGTEEEEGLRLLGERIDELASAPRFGGGLVYRQRKDGDWELWLPEGSSDLRRQYELLELQTRMMTNEGQRELLTAVLEKEESDVFVAGFQALQNSQTGAFTRWAVWPRGVPSYLPLVDYYAVEGAVAPKKETLTKSPPKKGFFGLFSRKQEEPEEDALRFVPQEVFFRLCREFLTPVEDLSPPMWLTSGEPNEAQLQALGEASVTLE